MELTQEQIKEIENQLSIIQDNRKTRTDELEDCTREILEISKRLALLHKEGVEDDINEEIYQRALEENLLTEEVEELLK